MTKPKFKVGDEVIILDKTFTFNNNTVDWFGLKKGDTVYINYVYTLSQLHPEEIIYAKNSLFAYRESNMAIFWEHDLEFKNEPANEIIRKEIEKRIKILEDRFHVDIKWTGTKRKRSL